MKLVLLELVRPVGATGVGNQYTCGMPLTGFEVLLISVMLCNCARVMLCNTMPELLPFTVAKPLQKDGVPDCRRTTPAISHPSTAFLSTLLPPPVERKWRPGR